VDDRGVQKGHEQAQADDGENRHGSQWSGGAASPWGR
jgi:hypothetical protein